jgi:cell division protease FtsH
MALGVTHQTPGADRHIMAQKELEARLRILMAGFASERLVMGDISTGAENDLKEATALASKMVAHYGMSERLGPVYYDHNAEHPFLGQRIAIESGTSEATVSTIEQEARRLLGGALERAGELLATQRATLDRLVTALLAQETIERDELNTLLGGSTAGADPASIARRPGGQPPA